MTKPCSTRILLAGGLALATLLSPRIATGAAVPVVHVWNVSLGIDYFYRGFEVNTPFPNEPGDSRRRQGAVH